MKGRGGTTPSGWDGILRFLLLVLIAVTATSAAAADIEPLSPPQVSDRPGSQVLFEGAWMRPLGDLADDFRTTELGFGASDGFEVGFRLRLYLNRRWSLAPAFHFVDYGDYVDTFEEGDPGEVGDEFRIQTSSQRFSVELRYALRDHDVTWQPYLAVAGGLYRNRVQGFVKDFTTVLDESVNSLGLEALVGLRISQLEFSALYVYNRFSTWRFFNTGYDTPYNWDGLGVRVGWIIPFETSD